MVVEMKMNPTATLFFGFLVGASVMLVVLLICLESIKRSVRRITDAEIKRQIEAREIEQKKRNQ